MIKKLIKFLKPPAKSDYTYFDSLIDIYGEEKAKRMISSMEKKKRLKSENTKIVCN